MRPLRTTLELCAQNFKKLMQRELYSEVVLCQRRAKQIFGLKVPFILDSNKNLYRNNLLTRIEILGNHDWRTDTIRIFYKRIEKLCRKYDVGFGSAINFCFCHETGHAKEQRLFEEINYFPNTVKTLPEGIPIKIESSDYIVTSNGFYDAFSCGIHDFSINAELAKQGITNKLAKKIFFDTSGLSPINLRTGEERHRFILESLWRLPFVLDVYEHGGLNEDEKTTLKVSQERVIGDKFEKALSLLKGISFFDPKSKLNATISLFKTVLGAPAYLGFKQDREILFRNCPNLPRFWSKDSYQILYV